MRRTPLLTLVLAAGTLSSGCITTVGSIGTVGVGAITAPVNVEQNQVGPSAGPAAPPAGTLGQRLPGLPGNIMPPREPGAVPAPDEATEPLATPRPAATRRPAPAAPAPTGRILSVSGTVRDESGRPVAGAVVTFSSLDVSVPYVGTAQTNVGGQYTIAIVPEGVQLELAATKAGYTARRIVRSFVAGDDNVVDFGGAAPADRAYCISGYPEIVQTSPGDGAEGVDLGRLTYKLTFSESLDEDSRDAFEKAFVIVPTSAESAINEAGNVMPFFDVAGTEAADGSLAGVSAGSFPYVLQENNTFMGSSVNKVKVSWNAAATEVTYTFEGNIKVSNADVASYQAVLFTPADRIEDADGNQLGTDATGAFNWPAPGTLLHNVFRAGNATCDASPGQTWAQTHTSAVRFSLKRDETGPKLTGLGVVEDNMDLRIELTFSEPMAAFVGSGKGYVDPTVFDLANYSFMPGEKSGDLTAQVLTGKTNVLPGGDVAAMASGLAGKQEFQFDGRSNGAYVVAKGGDLRALPEAAVAVEVEPDSPNTVNIWIRGGLDLFSGYRSLKARVSGVKDPAGNGITGGEADRSQVTSSI